MKTNAIRSRLPMMNESKPKPKKYKPSFNNDFFHGFTDGPFAETINHQIWHTSYGRTLVFIFQDAFETLISAFTFGFSLASFAYLKEQVGKTDFAEYGTLFILLFYFFSTEGFKLMKRAETPYVNVKMGGDYNKIYDHQEEIIKLQKELLDHKTKIINSQLIQTKAINPNLGI